MTDAPGHGRIENRESGADLSPDARWRTLRETWMAQPDVGARPMMGYPCLWRNGAFFAAFERASGCLVVKLAEARCEKLLAGGAVRPFRPRGAPFREWVLVPAADDDTWDRLVAEAYAFAGGV